MIRRGIPTETLMELRNSLDRHPPRSKERRILVEETAQLYGVSTVTIYRALKEYITPKSVRRADYGKPRVMPQQTLLRYCEIIAALKVRTSNGQGRHLSTTQAIRLLEEHGINTEDGHLQAPSGLLKKTTVNRYLKQWGYDKERLSRQPTAVRFEAEYSNQCWHFDLSSSDLKRLKNSVELEPGRGKPLLMLYSVVDDRRGLAYQEYHEVYGEDTGAALKFLFNAMSAKTTEGFPFQGIPKMLYMDNGPISRSRVFQKVMNYLGVEVRTHVPRGKDGRRVTARAKGKVERPFRTVKEMHETLYHLHEPETITEANTWLMQFLLHYNKQSHRRESHSRIEDWLDNLEREGIREMCSWERFCTFAREPEQRKVGIDARVTVDGVAYEVEPDLAGEKVILWWGLFDSELYVEYQETRYGPYAPIGKPIPLHSYRSFKKTNTQKRSDRIEALAKQLALPDSATGTVKLPVVKDNLIPFPVQFRHNGGKLSVVLAGHPKLKNDLRRPTLEEIGGRANVFALEGIRGHQSEYINWVLSKATKNKLQPTDLLTEDAISFLGERLSTPLQIEQYLTLAFEQAYRLGVKPVTTEIIESVLAIGLDDLEPSLIRHGYNAKTLAELLNVRTTEVRSFLHGQLPPGRTQDMRDQMLRIGIPL